MLEREQRLLDVYNAQPSRLLTYRLERLSRVHPAAHLVPNSSRWAVCGMLLAPPGFGAPGDDARRLCDRCRKWLEKQTRGLEV